MRLIRGILDIVAVLGCYVLLSTLFHFISDLIAAKKQGFGQSYQIISTFIQGQMSDYFLSHCSVSYMPFHFCSSQSQR